MTNYCIGFTIYKYFQNNIKKNKVDYFILPVDVIDGDKGIYQSSVSKNTYNDLKLKRIFGKKYFSSFKMEKEKVTFKIVIYSENDLEEVEKEYLPKIEKYLSRKLWFKPSFRLAFKKRIKRLLNIN